VIYMEILAFIDILVHKHNAQSYKEKHDNFNKNPSLNMQKTPITPHVQDKCNGLSEPPPSTSFNKHDNLNNSNIELDMSLFRTHEAA
jgi:hypothetical protein